MRHVKFTLDGGLAFDGMMSINALTGSEIAFVNIASDEATFGNAKIIIVVSEDEPAFQAPVREVWLSNGKFDKLQNTVSGIIRFN